MSENKLSIQRIIDIWSDRYGNHFPANIRRQAISDLIKDLTFNGYTKGDIERSKMKIMAEMVGPRSKFGSIADWKKAFHRDFEKVMRAEFEGNFERPEDFVVPKDYSKSEDQDSEEELNKFNQEMSEVDDSDDHSEVEFSEGPVFRPELDRSRFKNVKTPEIMSDEEFFATIERENNER